MTVHEFLDRFETQTRSGDGWLVRCPAHDDRKASLAITEAPDHKILLHCHAGCSVDAILAAKGLDLRDLFPPHGRKARRIVETYDYVGADGALRFQGVRYEPKDFRQRRPDGCGGWIWNMNGVERVLFQLPVIQGQRRVFIVEGEKDARRLTALGLPATTNVGGAGKWTDAYSTQLRDGGTAQVVILPDNDDAGRTHAAEVATSCDAAGFQVQVIGLPGMPDKGDVSDYLASHSTADLLNLVATAPVWHRNGPARVPAPYTLAALEQVFAKWIHDPDPLPTRAVLATYLANRKLDGDPTWLLLIGGSGIGKTERLNPLARLPDVILESSITGPGALLSGTGRKDRAKDASGGLLHKVPTDGGVLVLKDFTSIIDMPREPRAETLAAFREIHDGRWTRSIGTDGGKTLVWKGHLGLVAGCTAAYDSAFAVTATMGTRFLQIRLHDDDGLADSVLRHVGQEEAMRQALGDAVCGLLMHPPGTVYPLDDQIRPLLSALGKVVARARSPVDRDHQGEIRLVLDREAPTRIVKMLAQLWRAAGLLGLNRPEAWELVRRIGLDSIPKLRRLILDYLNGVPAATTTQAAEAVAHPTRTTRRALEDLTAHGVVQRQPGGEGKADYWMLSKEAKNWLKETLPEMSEDLQTPATALIETVITLTDKTGKVPPNETGAEFEVEV